MQNVEIFHEYTGMPCPKETLMRVVTHIYEGESIPQTRGCNIICSDDAHLQRLNAEYRNIDRPTDVLSFPFGEDKFLGELYISLQRVDMQAHEYGCGYIEELCRMVIHGFFHLLGYTHTGESTRLCMEKKEQEYLSSV